MGFTVEAIGNNNSLNSWLFLGLLLLSVLQLSPVFGHYCSQTCCLLEMLDW